MLISQHEYCVCSRLSQKSPTLAALKGEVGADTKIMYIFPTNTMFSLNLTLHQSVSTPRIVSHFFYRSNSTTLQRLIEFIIFYPNMTTLRSGICYHKSICRLTVTFVHPTPQYFFASVYLGHPLTSVQNFTEIVQGKPLHRGR